MISESWVRGSGKCLFLEGLREKGEKEQPGEVGAYSLLRCSRMSGTQREKPALRSGKPVQICPSSSISLVFISNVRRVLLKI